MSEHVLAVDPGGRTGWAAAHMGTNKLRFTGTGVLRQDTFARWLAEQQRIVSLVSGDGQARLYDVIVAESWRPRRQNGSMDWIENDPLLSAQHVGQIRLIADLSGARYVEQQPSDKPTSLASMPPEILALDEDSNEQHDKDARMHLWLYFFRNWFDPAAGPVEILV